MHRAGSRILAVVLASALGAGALGCGLLNQVKQTVDNVSAITDLADRMGKSGKLTFTAEYKTDDGTATTVVQQPPKAAYIGKDGRFILTEDALLICTGKTGQKVVCQKSAVQTGQLSSADQAAYLSAVAGGGFINTEMALAPDDGGGGGARASRSPRTPRRSPARRATASTSPASRRTPTPARTTSRPRSSTSASPRAACSPGSRGSAPTTRRSASSSASTARRSTPRRSSRRRVPRSSQNTAPPVGR